MSQGNNMTSRRSLMRSATAALVVNVRSSAESRPRVVVIGAGAFGGWTALHLLRQGAQVTLVDTWGPGNSRASSGGETRIIRATYGPDKVYFEMVARSLELWREHERRWNRRLFHPIGCMVMPGDNDAWEKASVPLFRDVGLPCEELSPAQAAKRWPQMRFEGVKWLIFEKEAGYLTARRNCAAVLEGFLQEGGSYRQLEAKPGRIRGRARWRHDAGGFRELRGTVGRAGAQHLPGTRRGGIAAARQWRHAHYRSAQYDRTDRFAEARAAE